MEEVAGFCQQGSKTSGSIKYWVFLWVAEELLISQEGYKTTK